MSVRVRKKREIISPRDSFQGDGKHGQIIVRAVRRPVQHLTENPLHAGIDCFVPGAPDQTAQACAPNASPAGLNDSMTPSE